MLTAPQFSPDSTRKSVLARIEQAARTCRPGPCLRDACSLSPSSSQRRWSSERQRDGRANGISARTTSRKRSPKVACACGTSRAWSGISSVNCRANKTRDVAAVLPVGAHGRPRPDRRAAERPAATHYAGARSHVLLQVKLADAATARAGSRPIAAASAGNGGRCGHAEAAAARPDVHSAAEQADEAAAACSLSGRLRELLRGVERSGVTRWTRFRWA